MQPKIIAKDNLNLSASKRSSIEISMAWPTFKVLAQISMVLVLSELCETVPVLHNVELYRCGAKDKVSKTSQLIMKILEFFLIIKNFFNTNSKRASLKLLDIRDLFN
jgi:hypothetical protein